MKNCHVCNAQLNDEAAFCTQCGTPLRDGQGPEAQAAPPSEGNHANAGPAPGAAPQAAYQPPQQNPAQAAPYVDPYDHTKEFSAQDISDNKVFAMLMYLTGWIGIIIALLASKESRYVAFHLRQALKIEVVGILLVLISAVLFWTFIIPIAGGVCMIILLVLRIISFFQICSGKAKEPAVIRSLGFLR